MHCLLRLQPNLFFDFCFLCSESTAQNKYLVEANEQLCLHANGGCAEARRADAVRWKSAFSLTLTERLGLKSGFFSLFFTETSDLKTSPRLQKGQAESGKRGPQSADKHQRFHFAALERLLRFPEQSGQKRKQRELTLKLTLKRGLRHRR